MAAYGYAQIPQIVPQAPKDYTAPLTDMGSVEQAISSTVQKHLQLALHQQELKRIDAVNQISVPLTANSSVAVQGLPNNENRITCTIFNSTDGQLFIGQKEDTSATLFETRLEPGSFHMFSDQDAQQGVWVFSPNAKNSLSISITEKLHDPSKDLFAPSTTSGGANSSAPTTATITPTTASISAKTPITINVPGLAAGTTVQGQYLNGGANYGSSFSVPLPLTLTADQFASAGNWSVKFALPDGSVVTTNAVAVSA